jgi:hypothetical protein
VCAHAACAAPGPARPGPYAGLGEPVERLPPGADYASRRFGATLPTVLDEYDTDDLAADAAAVRSLAARGLAEAQLRAVLAPLVTSASIIELELVGPGENALRCAEAWGADGTVRSLSEHAPGVWRLSDAPMIDVSRVPAVDRPLDGAPVRLPLERHVELDELLAARRLAEIAALLGPEGAQLAAAFADSGCSRVGCRAPGGRPTRDSRWPAARGWHMPAAPG